MDAQARLRADSEQLLRAQASSSAAAHWPPRPPSRSTAEPLNLEQLNRGLPTGWRCLEHDDFAGIPMYVHSATRTVSWGRPIACDVLEPTNLPPPDAEEQAIKDFLPEAEKMVAEAAAAEAELGPQMDVDDRLESDLRRRPRQPPLAGVFQHEPEDDGFGSYRDVQLRYLRHYTSACLGAHADISEAPATWTKWERPPVELTCVVLGVTVSKAYHTSARVGRGLVAEDALMSLCPGLWSEFRDRWALRPLEPSIVDPAVLNDLRVDDPRVCRLDLCLSKSPAMMLQEYCATHLGHFIVQTTDRRIEHDGKRQTEATVTAGSVTATAIDLYAKTARTQAAVNLLCKLNPEVELWRDMMRVNEKQLPKRGAPAIVNGLDEFPLSAGLLLPAQSSTAAQLLKQDRMSMQSHTKRVRDAELANRRADNPDVDADDGAMVVGDGDGDDDWERRQVPGQGPDFALEWQRQWDLEEKRKEVLGRGDRITNDTLFAFRYDKEREAANGARLAQLRAAFGEFDATPITEQLRRNEPATLGRGNYTQGIETRYQGLAQGESTAEASEWEPWREGTRTHARFVKIAHETVGAGGAAPVNPAADMPGVLTLNRAAMRMDAG